MVKALLQNLEEHSRHCEILATAHYRAANNARRAGRWCHVPAMIFNLCLGSVLYARLGEVTPESTKWASATVTLCAGLLLAMQSLFDFEGSERKHRGLGNSFNKIARRLAHIKAERQDELIDDHQFKQEYEAAILEYEPICARNEAVPVSRRMVKRILHRDYGGVSAQSPSSARAIGFTPTDGWRPPSWNIYARPFVLKAVLQTSGPPHTSPADRTNN